MLKLFVNISDTYLEFSLNDIEMKSSTIKYSIVQALRNLSKRSVHSKFKQKNEWSYTMSDYRPILRSSLLHSFLCHKMEARNLGQAGISS